MFFIICVQLHYISYIVVELCAQTCDIYIYVHIYIYIQYVYIYMCVCVCMCGLNDSRNVHPLDKYF